MSNYTCCCDNNDPVLSDEVTQFIEDKLGEGLTFIAVFGENGNILALKKNGVESKKISLPTESINTVKILDVKNASLLNYIGSDKCLWTFDGTHEEFTHPH